MNLRLTPAVAVLAVSSAFCVVLPSPVRAQQPQVTANPKTDANQKTWPLDQIITASVHDAWLLSGRNEAAFFDIVEQLAQLSAQKRGLTLPDDAAAGKRMGELIKEKARADRDQLLYVVVDQAVRAVGTKDQSLTR
jgi:hypothetical protein